MILKIFIEVLMDTNTKKGVVGMIMSIGMPLVENMERIIQVGGALLGLYLVVISIRHKRLQIKQLQKAIEENGKA
ncbi:hypothetical protein DF185_19920 [Marinifilum breve]|uniref:Uncharacterized protein n=1 Tax=Marinifilum breve TaxID=2184082 RepID=A0A2V4A693_9BACT|nr:hypothetical protein [Marinifilum breve]PXX96910.1 hypothetical protein DF185_19920 [Marinifilum breve]